MAHSTPRLYRVILQVSNIDRASGFYGELLGDRGRTRAWLRIIAELATAQGELGLIPEPAAREIAAHAGAELDLAPDPDPPGPGLLQDREVRIDPGADNNQLSLEEGFWSMLPELKPHPASPEGLEIRLDLFGGMMIAAGHDRPPTHEEPTGGGPTARQPHHRHLLPFYVERSLHLVPWFMVRGSWTFCTFCTPTASIYVFINLDKVAAVVSVKP